MEVSPRARCSSLEADRPISQITQSRGGTSEVSREKDNCSIIDHQFVVSHILKFFDAPIALLWIGAGGEFLARREKGRPIQIGEGGHTINNR